MVAMSEELKNKYQDYINYSNADTIFVSLDVLLKAYGRDFILQREHETEEDTVKSYVLRSSIMRYASDSIEHYIKAIIIQNGSTWDEAKSWGHNLLDLFNNLDQESRFIIIEAITPPNELDILNNNNIINDDLKTYDYLYKIFKKHDLIPIDNNNFINKEIKTYDNYKYYNDKPITIFQDENIRPINKDQTVEGELAKFKNPKEQAFGVKARYPGQFLVDGNAGLLISLAYALNKISIKYRKKKDKQY